MLDDTQSPKKKNKKTLLIIFVAWLTIMLVLGLIYSAKHYRRSFTVIKDTNAPVVIVNNVPISLKTLNLAMSGMLQSGSFVDTDMSDPKTQEKVREIALNNIIEQELLAQKAKNSKIEISKSQIDAEMYLIESQYASHDDFISKLSATDMSEQDLRNDIEKQLLIKAFQNKIYDSSTDIVKESDIKIFYDALSEKYIKQGEAPPSLDSAREKITTKILERRHQEYLEQVAKKLRDKAKIEVLI